MPAYESTTVRLDPHKTCILIEDLLPLYMEGEVSPGSRDMIVEHLAVCDRCAGFLAGAQSVRSHLRHGQRQSAPPSAARPPGGLSITGRLQNHPIRMVIAMLGAALLGSLGMHILSLSGVNEERTPVGFVLAICGFVMLYLLGKSAGRWSIVRLMALVTVYGFGCFAAILIAAGDPFFILGGAGLGIAVFFGPIILVRLIFAGLAWWKKQQTT